MEQGDDEEAEKVLDDKVWEAGGRDVVHIDCGETRWRSGGQGEEDHFCIDSMHSAP